MAGQLCAVLTGGAAGRGVGRMDGQDQQAAGGPGTGRRVLIMCAVDFTVRQFLLPLADRLERDGYRVTLACSRGPLFEDIAARGYDIRENHVSRSANFASHGASVWRTWRLLRRERFDVVHVHTPIAGLLGRVAARLAGVPVRIYTAHGFYFHDEMPGWKRRVHVMLEKVGAACGHFIMTVSDEDREAAIRLGIAGPEGVETVLNGVDVGHFDPARFSAGERAALRAVWGIGAEEPVVGFVGRMVLEKGIMELFDAVAELRRKRPDLRLLMVGDTLPSDRGRSGEQIRERAAALGLGDCIVRTGLVPDTAPCLACMDVFALPSYREGMPVSVLEAMAMGLPVVATNIRGCREEVAEGVTGLLVPARDSVALAAALGRLLDNGAEARAMGEAGRIRAMELFNIDRVMDHQAAIYGRLLAARG